MSDRNLARRDGRPEAPGSPAWWAGRTAQTIPRRGRPPRSRQRIVATALEMVDELGAEAFAMRLLADRLGSGTATLYRHFAGKDELMAYVVDEIVGELEAEVGGDLEDGRGGWREATSRWAVGLFEVLKRHPGALPLFVARVPVGPNALRMRERSLALLLDLGFTPALAARAYTTVAHYVVGFALQQHSPDAPSRDDGMRLRRYYEQLDPEVYPATVGLAEELNAIPLAEEFRFGLGLILDGIELALAGRRGGS